MLALEKSCDDKDQIIISCKHEAADKVKHLQSTIQVSNLSVNSAIVYHLCVLAYYPQGLHRQFTGSVPLPLQEKYSSMILKLQEDKITAEQQLAEVSVIMYGKAKMDVCVCVCVCV